MMENNLREFVKYRKSGVMDHISKYRTSFPVGNGHRISASGATVIPVCRIGRYRVHFKE